MSPFNNEIKRVIKEEQDNISDICKVRSSSMQIHHRVPENALKRSGIRGNNCKENGVALNRQDHLLADSMAIHNRLFWNGEAFVPLEQMPETTYHECGCMPERRKEHHHKRRTHEKHPKKGRRRR
jgi:hypothetical protein